MKAAKWIAVSPCQSHNTTVSHFYRKYDLHGTVIAATLHVTAFGVWEMTVNGERPGLPDEILRPGYTAQFRQVSSFDITPAVRNRGKTLVCEAFVAPSWAGDAICGYRKRQLEGAFRAAIVLSFADGTSETLVTDESWRGAWSGPVRYAGIYEGEDYDARQAGRATPAPTVGVVVPQTAFAELEPAMGPEVVRRRDLTLKPVSNYVYRTGEAVGMDASNHGTVVRRAAVRTADGRHRLARGETMVLDFGQNAAAQPDFVFRAKRGVTLKVNCAEMLNDGNGARCRGCDGPEGSLYRENYRSARSELNYTFAGGSDEKYIPSFTFFGYRYLSLTADGEIEIASVASVPVTSVHAESERGTIETGNAEINRLISNCRWGMYSNYLSVPTDCPQRDERKGWSGDTQVFAPAALYTADAGDFLRKWMRDMRGAVSGDGVFADIAPGYGTEKHSAAWADAGIIVPYRVWRMDGSKAIVEENWSAMSSHLEYLAKKTKDPSYAALRLMYADWLSFERLETFRDIVNCGYRAPTAVERRWWGYLLESYYLADARMMSEMARALGRAAEAEKYTRLADGVLARLRERYLPGGRLFAEIREMQTANLVALWLGLFESEASRDEARATLVASFAKTGGTLRTGFVGTSILLDTLSDAGLAKLAYDILLNPACPGWLFSVRQGATTMWERWDSYSKEKGFGSSGMNSFNHYAYGSVLSWLYGTAAGIRPGKDGGFDRFELKPSFDARLGYLRASYRTDRGVIRSEWKVIGDGRFEWTFEVPPGSEASVGDRVYGPGRHVITLK